MKVPLALVAAMLLGIGAIGGLAEWRAAHPSDREQELRWLESYAAWRDEIDHALVEGERRVVIACERSLLALAEVARTATVAKLEKVARSGCRALRRGYLKAEAAGDEYLSDALVAGWDATPSRVLSKLTDDRALKARPERSARLAAKVAKYAGSRPVVFCWSEKGWDELSEEWRTVVFDFWIAGYADWIHDRIHLAPTVCGPLERFFSTSYAPSLNLQSFELAEALVTLAHEGEHLRSPQATESQVECVALQRVRDLVRDAGRSRSYEDLMAGLAWDVGYPRNLPQYRTNFCSDGGPLDVRPHTDVWP